MPLYYEFDENRLRIYREPLREFTEGWLPLLPFRALSAAFDLVACFLCFAVVLPTLAPVALFWPVFAFGLVLTASIPLLVRRDRRRGIEFDARSGVVLAVGLLERGKKGDFTEIAEVRMQSKSGLFGERHRYEMIWKDFAFKPDLPLTPWTGEAEQLAAYREDVLPRLERMIRNHLEGCAGKESLFDTLL